MTHTYVECPVSPAAHAEIKADLLAAGYGHAIEGDVIDMHGLALVPKVSTTHSLEDDFQHFLTYSCAAARDSAATSAPHGQTTSPPIAGFLTRLPMTNQKKPDTLANHMPHDKWTALREKERITRLSVPHLNSTMTGTYRGEELSYRGQVIPS